MQFAATQLDAWTRAAGFMRVGRSTGSRTASSIAIVAAGGGVGRCESSTGVGRSGLTCGPRAHIFNGPSVTRPASRKSCSEIRSTFFVADNVSGSLSRQSPFGVLPPDESRARPWDFETQLGIDTAAPKDILGRRKALTRLRCFGYSRKVPHTEKLRPGGGMRESRFFEN